MRTAPVRAGDYRHILQYQTLTRSLNPQRQPVETWTTHSTHPAAIEGLNGREQLAVQGIEATAAHRIRLRFCPSLTFTPKSRFREPATGRVFNVASVTDRDGTRREMTILATELQT